MKNENSIYKPYNRDITNDNEVGCNFGHRLQNTEKFRPAALAFESNGKYTSHPYSSFSNSPYGKYWAEQKRRSLDGYFVEDGYTLDKKGNKIFKGGVYTDYKEDFESGKIKGDWITGYYYFYLNFSPIQKVKYNEKEKIKLLEGKQVKGERVYGFPDVWDYDYYYFHYLEEAMTLGKHGSVLKSRGKGFSLKGASMARRNFHLVKGSKSFAFASKESFLIKDGIITKSNNIGTFLNTHTGFRKMSQRHNRPLHVRASYYENKIEKGYMSEIIGKTLNNKPDDARGIRGQLILWEEAGEFPGLLKAWQIARESVEQDGVTFGLMIAFGTGGSKMESYRTLNELYFNPGAYNIHGITNIWSKKKRKKNTGFFCPSYVNINGLMDKDGNTNLFEAYNIEKGKLENMEALGTDPSAIMQKRSERPLTPEDALLRAESNSFPVRKLDDRISDLLTKREEGEFSRIGKLKYNNGKVEFIDDLSVNIVRLYPHDKQGNNEGGIEIWDMPILRGGVVPDGIYIMGVDPYDQDSSTTVSLGSSFVMNKISGTIVAEYTGRPQTAEEYFEGVLLLAMFFNARVNFENNLLGLKWYFEKKNKLHYLVEAPEIVRKISKVALQREYGTPGTMGINKLGRTLIKTWLLSKIIDDEMIQQVNLISSVPLLQELSGWNLSDNFDRVSALIMLMILYEENKGIEGYYDDSDKDIYDAAADSIWDEQLGIDNSLDYKSYLKFT